MMRRFSSTRHPPSHSIKVKGMLEIPLEMHGAISHLRTRLPTNDEPVVYHDGQFQSVQLTDNTTWEPHHTPRNLNPKEI
jgi:hypothetical protein